MDRTSRVFTSKDESGTEVTLKLNKPSHKVSTDANFVYSQTFSKAIRNGIMTNAEAFDIVKKNGIWSDDDEARAKELRDKIKDLETAFESAELSNEQGMDKVKEIKALRSDLANLNSKINSVTDNTAETMANDSKNQFIAAMCTVDSTTGKKVFKDLDDFLLRSSEKIAIDSFTEAILANYEAALGVKLSADMTSDLPENKWLSQRKLDTKEVADGVEDSKEEKKRGRPSKKA